jgi:hypothetical protein
MQMTVFTLPDAEVKRIEKYRHRNGKFYGHIWRDRIVLDAPLEAVKITAEFI